MIPWLIALFAAAALWCVMACIVGAGPPEPEPRCWSCGKRVAASGVRCARCAVRAELP